MDKIQTTISNLIENQFPSIYKEEGQNLIAFIQAYYEWMESEDNPLYHSRRLIDYSDIDTTLEEFIIHFKETYLAGVQFDTLSDKRLTVKKILDLYRSKGNDRALKLLFRLVFKEDIDIYYPGDDIIKPSDGIWNIPVYLEVTHSPRNNEYVGKTVTGLVSGATAFVDRLIRRKSDVVYRDIFYITGNKKDFVTGESLRVDDNSDNRPVVIGSLSSLIVDEGGANFAVGDIVNLSSIDGFGRNGKARVDEIKQVTGIVDFKLKDGGWGYTSDSDILISETVLTLANVQSTFPTYVEFLPKFSTVVLNNPANNAANVTANVFAFSTTPIVVGTQVGAASFLKNEMFVSTYGTASVNGYIQFVNKDTTTTPPTITLNLSNVFNSFIKPGSILVGQTSGAQINVTSFNTDVGVIDLSDDTTNHTKLYLKNNDERLLSIDTVSGDFTYGEQIRQWSAASGTAATTAACTDVTGTTTSFTTQFIADDYIRIANSIASEVRQIASITNTTFLTVTTPFSNTFSGAGVYYTSGRGNILDFSSNTMLTTVDHEYGDFVTNKIIIGANSEASANVTAVANVEANATITNISTGIDANFVIKNLSNTETVFLATDYISDNNANDVPYVNTERRNRLVDLTVTGSTSGYSNTDYIVISNTTLHTINAQATLSTNGTGGFTNLDIVIANTGSFYRLTGNTDVVIAVKNSSGGSSSGTGATLVANLQLDQVVYLNDLAYGFPKKPDANATYGTLVDVLNFEIKQLGAIESIRITNQGKNYNDNPYVDILESRVANRRKQDYVLTVGNLTGAFATGEKITQDVPLGTDYKLLTINTVGIVVQTANVNTTTDVITYTSHNLTTGVPLLYSAESGTPITGLTDLTKYYVIKTGTNTFKLANTYHNSINATPAPINLTGTGNNGQKFYRYFSYGEAVYQNNGVSNTAVGVVIDIGDPTIANTLLVKKTSGNFTTSYNVHGVSSLANAAVTDVATEVQYGHAIGRIQSISGSTLYVRRLSINQDFEAGANTIVGELSAATGNITKVSANLFSLYSGDNANVQSNVVTANGTVSVLSVVDSGFAYANSELVNFESQDGTKIGTARAVLERQGIGEGYYMSTRGFLDSNKYIQDGTYYQEFSYEIESTLSLSKYAKMVKDVVHVAGTKMFGAIVRKSMIENAVNVESEITITQDV
mgnify:CR=1 FL=1